MEEENKTNLGQTVEPSVVEPVSTTPVYEAPVAQAAPETQILETPAEPTPVAPTPEPEKNENSQKLLAAFIMLVVTVISLTTASYAWFTENTTVTVDSLTVNVGAANGIQISVDAVNWKANISNTDITSAAYSGHTNQVPSQIVPVSTIGDVDTTTGFMNMYKGGIVASSTAAHGYIITADKTTETAGTSGDFIAFDLFILATQETTIYLTTSSDVTASGDDVGLKNAARVAFLYEGYADTGQTANAIALKGAGSHSASPSTNVFWEPNNDVHTAGGVAQANTYGQTSFGNNTTVASYYGVKAAITAENNIDYQSTSATYFASVTPDITTPANNTANGEYETLFTLHKGINKVRIYGWVEGQDYDCENLASGSSITFNIQISKNTGATS